MRQSIYTLATGGNPISKTGDQSVTNIHVYSNYYIRTEINLLRSRKYLILITSVMS